MEGLRETRLERIINSVASSQGPEAPHVFNWTSFSVSAINVALGVSGISPPESRAVEDGTRRTLHC